ncbi:MAG: hypothetical protein IID33_12440, partial [Planctomycetes bacterium]|nr:hypothetical protein [Planctomycetota bacterium]
KMAAAATETQICRVFMDKCIKMAAVGTLDNVTSAMAKYWTNELMCRVLDECVQLHGGYGVMYEYPIARAYMDARPGPIWQKRHAVGRVSSWFRCAVDPILRPTEFGMQCRLGNQSVDHRRFFLLHLPPIFLTASFALLCMLVLMEGLTGFRENMGFIVPASLFIGYICCIGTLGVTLAGSTLVGLFHSFREKRNLLPGAMQIASYLGGFLMLWAMFGALLILAVTALQEAEAFESLQDRWAINPITAMQFLVIAPNAAVGIWYLILLSRGTVATRYANK